MVSEASTWHLLHGQGIRTTNTFYQFIRRTPKSALLWVGFVCFIDTVRSLPVCMCTWAYVWILCVFRSQRIISAITHRSTCSISISQAHATSYVFFFFFLVISYMGSGDWAQFLVLARILFYWLNYLHPQVPTYLLGGVVTEAECIKKPLTIPSWTSNYKRREKT